MAQSCICPHCGNSFSVRELPFTQCPHCGRELPDALVAELESNYVPQRPFSLSLQMYAGYILGLLMLAALPWAFQPVDTSILEQLGIPPMMTLPPILMGTLSVFKTAFLLLSSRQLHRHDPRSRMTLLLMVFVFTVPETAMMAPMLSGSELGSIIFATSAIIAILSLSFAYLYLYHWKAALRYYGTLEYLRERGRDRV